MIGMVFVVAGLLECVHCAYTMIDIAWKRASHKFQNCILIVDCQGMSKNDLFVLRDLSKGDAIMASKVLFRVIPCLCDVYLIHQPFLLRRPRETCAKLIPREGAEGDLQGRQGQRHPPPKSDLVGSPQHSVHQVNNPSSQSHSVIPFLSFMFHILFSILNCLSHSLTPKLPPENKQ